MAYDEELAQRVRELLLFDPDIVEKKMFGGLAFLIGGHMSVAVSGGGGLLLRNEPEDTEELLAQPHCEPFVMRGRAMSGWVRLARQPAAAKMQSLARCRCARTSADPPLYPGDLPVQSIAVDKDRAQAGPIAAGPYMGQADRPRTQDGIHERHCSDPT